MEHNLKTISKILEESRAWSRSSLSSIVGEVDAVEKELREHYKEYKELAKPPECDETWYCLQYLELLIEEILGD
ncbi:MAG: hypothetical protein KAT53_06420, partial [Dehalococcoidia bacterium]|nr:hypothetical protein [Dehalococcoidia bacterium]